MAPGRLDAVDVTLTRLEASSATLARSLLDLDARAARVLPAPAATASAPGSQTAMYAGRARDRLDWLWDRFTTLSEVLTRARTLRTGGPRPRRTEELEALLHRASVPRKPPPPHADPAAAGGGVDDGDGDGGGVGAGGPVGAVAGISIHPEELLVGTAETVAAANADLDLLETARSGSLATLAAAERELAELTAALQRIGLGSGSVAELAAARTLPLIHL